MRDAKAARLPRQGFGLVMRLMAASVLVVAAGVASSAHAESRAGRGGPEMMMFAGSPERVGRSVDRMLGGLNATDAQRSTITQIATAAAADLKAQLDAGRGLREQSLRIFTAPTVDAVAAESLRTQMAAQREQGSRRTLQAMLDVANVLTPEQRATLGERMAKREAGMKDRTQRMRQERAPRDPAAPQPAPQR